MLLLLLAPMNVFLLYLITDIAFHKSLSLLWNFLSDMLMLSLKQVFWKKSVFFALTLFRIGLFGAAHGWEGGGGQKNPSPPLPKICYTYPAIIKLGTVMPYLRKIQKIYESRDIHFEFADISIFHRKSENFPIPRNTDIDCILKHNF